MPVASPSLPSFLKRNNVRRQRELRHNLLYVTFTLLSLSLSTCAAFRNVMKIASNKISLLNDVIRGSGTKIKRRTHKQVLKLRFQSISVQFKNLSESNLIKRV